jgi:hypothetical protein
MSFKPSDAEEEYFVRKEFEKKKKLAEEQMKLISEKEKENLKNLHFMRCPKCGMELIMIKFRDVEVDECPSCKGFWLDAGEVEKIISEKETFLSNVLKIFK